MNDAILTVGDLRVVATEPFDTESPRWGAEFGTMLCLHPRYNLGDEHVGVIADVKAHFEEHGPEATWQWMRDTLGTTVVLPLYLHDHSGLSMTAGANLTAGWTPDHAMGWDSSLVGAIFDTAENRLDWLGDVEAVLRAEVDEYDKYLRGDVHVLRIERQAIQVTRITTTFTDGTSTETVTTATVWLPVPDAGVTTTYGDEHHGEIAAEMLAEHGLTEATA